MKKFFVSMALMSTALSAMSADKVTFTRFAYDEGDYLYRTYATSQETPYATQIRPEQSGMPYVFQIILLSDEVRPVYTISINVPVDHDYCYPLIFVDEGGSYINDILVTQHLFNDDDLYEVVLRGEDDTYWIYNEKGEFLGELPAKAHKLYQHGDKLYLYAEYEDGINTTVSALYEINKGNDALMTVVAENSRLLASPNPVKTGETVTLTLPEALSSEMQIKIFNTNGVLLAKYECAVGETEISIPAYRLETGINPVVVINSEGDIIYTGKIIRE